MWSVVEVDDVSKWNSVSNGCEPHAPTRTTMHKGGWFGLTVTHLLFAL